MAWPRKTAAAATSPAASRSNRPAAACQVWGWAVDQPEPGHAAGYQQAERQQGHRGCYEPRPGAAACHVAHPARAGVGSEQRIQRQADAEDHVDRVDQEQPGRVAARGSVAGPCKPGHLAERGQRAGKQDQSGEQCHQQRCQDQPGTLPDGQAAGRERGFRLGEGGTPAGRARSPHTTASTCTSRRAEGAPAPIRRATRNPAPRQQCPSHPSTARACRGHGRGSRSG